MRVFDGHCDTAFELWRRKESFSNNTCHIDLEKCSPFDAYAQVFAFCSYAGTPLEREPLLDEPLYALKKSIDGRRIGFAQDSQQIKALNQNGCVAAMLSIEGAELIDCDIDRLPTLRQNGFRICGITWNCDNILAGCHLDENDLSSKGVDFVRVAEELGIYIDVSHMGERSFWHLLDIAKKPILATHSNCRQLCENSRNLTDDQLKAIAQTGGTIGLNLYAPFVGEDPDFSDLRRHLEHMLRLCGEKHIALGGDLDGCDVLVKGFVHIGSYCDFYAYLKSCGYDDMLLDQIFYLNLLHLF